jgi:hypothetical protein
MIHSAICWNLPSIPYAARYGVGTISREDGLARTLNDYTPSPVRAGDDIV